MIKKFISISLIIAFIFSTSYTAHADNPQDAIVNSKIKFQQMNENIINTNKQVSLLNTEIAKIKIDINKNNINIDKNSKEIDKEKVHMEELENQVSFAQGIANKRLRVLYINSYSESFISVLLSSKNITDFLYKYDAIESVMSYDAKVFNDLEIKKSYLNESINSLKIKEQDLQKLKDSNMSNLSKLNNDKSNLEALIVQFNKEKNSAIEIIKENEEKLIAHSVAAIDSNSSTIQEVQDALSTLNSLISQISTASVKNKARSYISLGNKKLTELIAINTSPVINDNNSYKASFAMVATAYTGGTITALGLKPVREPSGLSTIAVDPSVLPLGAKVYIPGYGYAISSDTGSAIKGNIIDLYMNSEADCYAWGKRSVTLYIVAYPGQW
ncbi:3D domain-containing protein [Candidatus Clostridium radicumherbarum]|uniref:3D domain-containing protein n=1 Tax=Candidatus Clostridium radicumherbarum TaxID=3381662 RepID=A0ABW8TPG5_9CLOT